MAKAEMELGDFRLKQGVIFCALHNYDSFLRLHRPTS